MGKVPLRRTIFSSFSINVPLLSKNSIVGKNPWLRCEAGTSSGYGRVRLVGTLPSLSEPIRVKPPLDEYSPLPPKSPLQRPFEHSSRAACRCSSRSRVGPEVRSIALKGTSSSGLAGASPILLFVEQTNDVVRGRLARILDSL